MLPVWSLYGIGRGIVHNGDGFELTYRGDERVNDSHMCSACEAGVSVKPEA